MLCRWALNEGQDFVVNNQVAGVDFATLHCWPDKCGQQHTVTREASPHTAYSISSHVLLHAAGWTTTCNSNLRGCGSMPQMRRRSASRCALHLTLLLHVLLAPTLVVMRHSRHSIKRVAACAGAHGGVWEMVSYVLGGPTVSRRYLPSHIMARQ